MSKSRLEKFLYALYSLDSSDLPKPLSRIEELYSCLVTGDEVPIFKPLSRVEKYLMAILGAYDVDSLPNPTSRVEVLLHKLAIGDDNLDDVKSFLSEHEELLAEIIRNAGAGGNINIEYVLYTLSTEHNTLYNTAEKPVKSAVLKGQTLVNIVNNDNWVRGYESDNYNTLFTQNISVKKGQTYTVMGKMEISDIINALDNMPAFRIRTGTNDDGTTLFFVQQSDAVIKQTFTNNENDTIYVKFFNQKTNYKKLMIIEGDYTNVDIPYFEGMQSVENPVMTTTGKNLFDVSRLPQTVNIAPASTGYILSGYSCGTGMLVSKMFPNLIVEKKYVFSFQSSSSGTTNAQNSIGFYNMNTDELIFYRNNESFTLTNEMYYESRVILYGVGGETTEFSNVQLEEGSVATEYEPYKSTTVTCNEDVELHGVGGVGDVKDELDLMTGEVTRRIGEVVLNGSEDWVQSGMGDPTIFYTSLNDMAHNKDYLNSISCDKFVTYIYEGSLNDSTLLNGITGYFDNTDTYPNENWLYIKRADSEGSVENLKQWLSQNPVTVRYELITESVETVDISVVDQDGNDTELKTFNDITYVTLSSEGPIPEAELEVATKNEEDLDDSIVYTAHTLSEEFNTLYDTTEKPVKSAILKGQTLVNVLNPETEGMQSVKMPVLTTTGKNLFDISKCKPGRTIDENGNEVTTSIPNYYAYGEFIPINNEFTMSITSNNGSVPDNTNGILLRFYDEDKNLVDSQWFSGSFKESNGRKYRTISMNGAKHLKMSINATGAHTDTTYEAMQTIQIEQGSTATSYEHFKSNILTVNEDVELRGIGNVKDELNLLTGELTQRIAKLVIDGSEYWEMEDGYRCYLPLPNLIKANNYIGRIICDGDYIISSHNINMIDYNKPTLTGYIDSSNQYPNYNWLYIYIPGITTVQALKEHLSQNPVTVQYELTTESIKTIDISTVDQNGNNTKLSTFNDITHVTLSSEGLIPEAKLEVAEKVTEVAASMLTISREQEVLNTTTNEQSENVDATMIATTEIYEELL